MDPVGRRRAQGGVLASSRLMADGSIHDAATGVDWRRLLPRLHPGPDHRGGRPLLQGV